MSRKRELMLIYRSRIMRHNRPFQGVRIRNTAELLWIARIHKWPLQRSSTKRHFHLAKFSQSTPPCKATDGVSWARVDLRGAILENVDASSLDFTDAWLTQCRFEACSLASAKLARADLRGSQFVDTPLDSAILLDKHDQEIFEHDVPGGNLSAYVKASSVLTAPAPGPRIRISTRNELLWLIHHLKVDVRFVDLRSANLFEDDIRLLNIPPDAMKPDRWPEIEAKILENWISEKPLLADVKIASWQEWYWLKSTPAIASTYMNSDPPQFDMCLADLRNSRFQGAKLTGVNLSRAHLEYARLECADLSYANLDRAHLDYAQLNNANLQAASLRRAVLERADLEEANLFKADLRKAYLPYASLLGAIASATNLRAADCLNADFRCTDLRGAEVSASTSLIDIAVNSATMWGDVIWHGTPLLEIDWTQIERLGDEMSLYLQTLSDDLKKRDAVFRDVTRAYHQLYLKLKDQGYYAISTKLRLREKRLERQQLWEHRQYRKWLYSFVAFLLIGYGEKPGRLIIVYAAVVEVWAAVYLQIEHMSLAPSQQKLITSTQALLLSLSALRGSPNFPSQILRQHVYGSLMNGFGIAETWVGSIILLAFTILWTQQLMGNELPYLRLRRRKKHSPGELEDGQQPGASLRHKSKAPISP